MFTTSDEVCTISKGFKSEIAMSAQINFKNARLNQTLYTNLPSRPTAPELKGSHGIVGRRLIWKFLLALIKRLSPLKSWTPLEISLHEKTKSEINPTGIEKEESAR